MVTRPVSGSTSFTVVFSRMVPGSSRAQSTSTRSARRSTTTESPCRAEVASSVVFISHRPSARRTPASPWIADSPRISSPTPIVSRALSALAATASPAPTGSRDAARSNTVTSQPRCCSATAAVSPPIPAPITTACAMTCSSLRL